MRGDSEHSMRPGERALPRVGVALSRSPFTTLACVAVAAVFVLDSATPSAAWHSVVLRGYLTPMWIVRTLEVRLGLPRLGCVWDAVLGTPILFCPYLIADAIWRAIIGPARLALTD